MYNTLSPPTPTSPPGRSVPSGPRRPELRRPGLAARASIALLGVAMLAFNAALMMSDRAPRALRILFGDVVRSLSERIDAGGRVDRHDARRLAGDATVHIGVWFVAVVLLALAIWTWRGLASAAIGVFAASIVVEVGQERFSTTRTVEPSDIFFNGVGVAFGTLVAALVFNVWDIAATRRARSAVR